MHSPRNSEQNKDEKIDRKIYKSILHGDLKKIRETVLSNRECVDRPVKNGLTPLQWAAGFNQIDILKFLLFEKKVFVNTADSRGCTAVFLAAELGNIGAVNVLLEAKADVNIAEQTSGSTPLYIASQNGHLEIVKAMVAAQADVNKAEMVTGTSPLYIASQRGHVDIVKVLIATQADVNKAKITGTSPLSIAVQKGHMSIVRELVAAQADTTSVCFSGKTALHLACDRNSPNFVSFLLDANCDMKVRDLGGCTPLLRACYSSGKDVVTVLLERGADVTDTCWNGNTALHLAAFNGNSDIVKILCSISHNLIDSANIFGMNPLHLAAKNGQLDVFRELLQFGADLSSPDSDGNTPFHLAVMNKKEHVIDFLLAQPDKIGKLMSKNCSGVSVIDYIASLYPEKYEALTETESLLRVTELVRVPTPACMSVRIATKLVPTVSHLNIRLVRVKQFLEFNRLMDYNVCEENNLHVSGEEVCLTHRVLFISHRWESDGDPDSEGAQFALIVAYIENCKQSGVEFDFIWFYYGCVCQDKNSALFKTHLLSIPIAVCMAAECLIVPKVAKISGDSALAMTDYSDYFSRAWCLFETLACLLSGTQVTLAFKTGDSLSFQKLRHPADMASELGFVSSQKEALRVFLEQCSEFDTQYVARTVREIHEPCRILVLLSEVFCSGSKYEHVTTFFDKARTMQLQEEDKDVSTQVSQIWNLLGDCKFVEDKVSVFNLMMFVGYYSLRKRNNFKAENQQEKTNWASGHLQSIVSGKQMYWIALFGVWLDLLFSSRTPLGESLSVLSNSLQKTFCGQQLLFICTGFVSICVLFYSCKQSVARSYRRFELTCKSHNYRLILK